MSRTILTLYGCIGMAMASIAHADWQSAGASVLCNKKARIFEIVSEVQDSGMGHYSPIGKDGSPHELQLKYDESVDISCRLSADHEITAEIRNDDDGAYIKQLRINDVTLLDTVFFNSPCGEGDCKTMVYFSLAVIGNRLVVSVCEATPWDYDKEYRNVSCVGQRSMPKSRSVWIDLNSQQP